MVALPVRQHIFVGVRGTQYAYDWFINLRAGKSRLRPGERFHSGFLKEAEKLGSQFRPWLAQTVGKRGISERAVFVSGHSLGGAVAAILTHMGLSSPPSVFPSPTFCMGRSYVFGSPRIAASGTLVGMSQPLALRRVLDIVPHCPPMFLNFADFMEQHAPDGGAFKKVDGIEFYFFASWLTSLALNRFLDVHSMEGYRRDTLSAAGSDPRISRYWRYPAT